MINNVTLVGRLTSDVEINTSSSGTKFCRFTLAVSRPLSRDNNTDFISCVSFNKTAELMNTYLSKGSLIAVEGKITSSSYVNKEGRNITRQEVNVDRVVFLEKKKQEGNNKFFDQKPSNVGNDNSNINNDLNEEDLGFAF